jgi:putative oxidoreductase
MKTILQYYKKIIQPVIQKNWWSDMALAFPRIICGLLLAKDFGADKFGMPWSPAHLNLDLFEVAYWFPQDVASFGGCFALFPVFFAWMGAFSEAVGGIFLALGFQTRLAASLLMVTMLVAMLCQKWGQGTWQLLPAMGFLWVAVYALVLGSGRFGLDQLLSGRLNKMS